MSTFALIHGGGGSAWDWHLVAAELRERGHDPVAVDLPTEDPAAGWWDYADTIVEAVGDRRTSLVVVGNSLGGFTAPLVCARIPADLLVLVAGMIPAPGELFTDWWKNTGYEASGYEDVFYHDVPPELAAEAQTRERDQAIGPKSRVMLGLIGEVLGLPPEHPVVQRGLMFALLPCLVILVAPKEVPARVLPAVARESGGLADDFIRYAMAGLEALAAAHRPQAHPTAKSGRGARRTASGV